MTHDLSGLEWCLRGFIPYQWGWERSMETGVALVSDIPALPARVPGSVQAALRQAGLLPDWNSGLEARACEWVEHRHWMFEAGIPDEWLAGETSPVELRCEGLDGSGWVLVNGLEVGRFDNAFVPYQVDLTPALGRQGNRLQIVFDCPPRWLGQYGYTSQMTDWKPRFNYSWDWTSRLVQIGIWDRLTLECGGNPVLRGVRCVAMGRALRLWAGPGRMRVTLSDGSRILRSGEFEGELFWDELEVESWWPNGMGARSLYRVRCERVRDGAAREWRVGFKTVEWRPCEGAPEGADPWLCVVNGIPVFLQGVNWTPIRPNFADVSQAEIRKRLLAYRDMGCNILRVWGGAVLETEYFYDLCDELGLLVWQEFPLSSSGLENWPPESPPAIEAMGEIAASYITRRQHHAALLCWCGGNELQGGLDGGKVGIGKPVDARHPLIARLKAVVALLDPGRRFLDTSAAGPRFTAESADFGKGLHWDVHGPWNVVPADYWLHDDALFRSEVGAPGASPVEVIREFSGGLPDFPATLENPLWRRASWWLQWADYVKEQGREPQDLESFVAWSQGRQAEALALAVGTCKARFPRCGGVILWMGHDSFPCTANTALFDFHGNPKPAVAAVAKLFLKGAV